MVMKITFAMISCGVILSNFLKEASRQKNFFDLS